MTKIPAYRDPQSTFRRLGFQEFPVVPLVPVPTGVDTLPEVLPEGKRLLHVEVWDEIDREPVLMRTLPRSRFRDAFGDKLALPDRVAERLEDLEIGLREAGFIRDDELLSKRGNEGLKFRVKVRNVLVDGHLVAPSVKAAAPAGPVPSLTEGPSQSTALDTQSRAESEASLDGGSRVGYPALKGSLFVHMHAKRERAKRRLD